VTWHASDEGGCWLARLMASQPSLAATGSSGFIPVEGDSPGSFRLPPQRDPGKIIVESPVEPGSSICPLEVEMQGSNQ